MPKLQASQARLGTLPSADAIRSASKIARRVSGWSWRGFFIGFVGSIGGASSFSRTPVAEMGRAIVGAEVRRSGTPHRSGLNETRPPVAAWGPGSVPARSTDRSDSTSCFDHIRTAICHRATLCRRKHLDRLAGGQIDLRQNSRNNCAAFPRAAANNSGSWCQRRSGKFPRPATIPADAHRLAACAPGLAPLSKLVLRERICEME